MKKLFSIMRKLKFMVGSKLVNIEDCKNPLGHSFDPEGYHFLVEALTLYEIHGYDRAEAYVKNYYQNFRPTNSNFLNVASGVRIEWQIDDPFQYPWGNFSCDDDVIPKKDIINARICGPNDLNKTESDFRRFIELYENIKRTGMTNPIITGAFMLKNGQLRFIVLQGNHRTAILAKLGIKQIRVKKLDSDKNVRYEDLKMCMYVRQGKCSLTEAQLYFNTLFDSSGMKIKEFYGL